VGGRFGKYGDFKRKAVLRKSRMEKDACKMRRSPGPQKGAMPNGIFRNRANQRRPANTQTAVQKETTQKFYFPLLEISSFPKSNPILMPLPEPVIASEISPLV
jgi:hypothetical protein